MFHLCWKCTICDLDIGLLIYLFNLWPWPWPSHINFSNRSDIFSNSCYYYLCEYVKGFVNILWEHCRMCFKIWLNYCFFFNFFENVPFVTLTLTFTFIFIVCLGLVSIEDTIFYITILVLFLPSSATLHKKGFKLVKNPLFLHFESRQLMTLTMTFIHQFLQPVWYNFK